jgi:hypothetical protein
MRNRLQLMPLDGERALDAAYKSATHLMDASTAEAIVRFVAAVKRVDVRINAVLSRRRIRRRVPLWRSSRVAQPGVSAGSTTAQARGRATHRRRSARQHRTKVIDEHYDDCMDGQPENVHRFVENELVTESGFRKPVRKTTPGASPTASSSMRCRRWWTGASCASNPRWG